MSATNFQSAIYRLLPTGKAFPPENIDSNIRNLMYAVGDTIEALYSEIYHVVNLYYPINCITEGMFVKEWEEVLGLPKCGDAPVSNADRLARILVMFNFSEYSNAEFFESIAAVFGYDITVSESSNPFEIVINIPTNPVEPEYFRTNLSGAGDKLADTGGNVEDSLKCILEFFKPAHAYITYST